MSEFDFDVAVVGGGSGGYAAARTAAAAGARVAVIEGGEEVGGLCILRGCMPTKALLYAAEVRQLARHAGTWGMTGQALPFDFARVMERKNALIKEFADYRRTQLAEGPFKFIRARARFMDAHTLALSTGESLTAASFIISTGSVVSPPPAAFLNDLNYITSDEALTLERLPKSLIILGGGSVALEFAQFFARFDVKVTVIQRGAGVLRDFDRDAAGELEKVLRREGVEIFAGFKLTGAAQTAGGKQVSFERGEHKVTVEAEEVLYALGRVPNTDSLGLEKAGVTTEDGRILADEEMRTSAPHIFAAGDCTGPHEIVHVAVLQGEAAGQNAVNGRPARRMDYRLLINVVFTEPQIAQVGLTEKEAAHRRIPHLSAKYWFADHGKALIMEAKDGFVKLLADPASGEILGGACAGPLGGELIHEIVVAMHQRMTVQAFATVPHYHPTLAEIWTYPAEELAEKVQAGQGAAS